MAPSSLDIREIGIPVRAVSWATLHAGRGREGRPCIYAVMGQQVDDLFVLQVDPETGECRQFGCEVPNAQYPTAKFISRTGRLYVGAANVGHLLCFDPETDALVDLGAIHPGAAHFPCRIDEGPDGRIWIGSYPAADLTCYDPDSGEFVRYGRMDDEDMYNYPFVNSDGTVACLIRMTRPHVVVFDPETGRKQTVGPVVTAGEGTLDLRRGDDGLLYIESSAGRYRIDGTQAVPVESVPDPAPTAALPDGSSFAFADETELVYRKLEVRGPGGETRNFELDYDAGGTEIFYLHAGPDECLYGSSVLPLHLFRYNPKDGELIDLGRCSSAGGEAYSMANLEGKIYISSYGGAVLSVYDPSQSYHYDEGPGGNPRDLGRIDDISCRPRSTLAGPLGRVWTASIPDYGRWGGPLSYYDPRTREKKAYYRIFGDGSCFTLAHLERHGLMAVGTSVHGGSGTRPKVDQAVLFLWDYTAGEKVWEGTLDRPVSVYNALVAGPDGRLYGTVTGEGTPGELFAFDPETRTFGERVPLPPGKPLDLGLQNGPDGRIYGFTSSCLYRFDPGTLAMEVLAREDDAFRVAGPILGDSIYFATGHRLRTATLPRA